MLKVEHLRGKMCCFMVDTCENDGEDVRCLSCCSCKFEGSTKTLLLAAHGKIVVWNMEEAVGLSKCDSKYL